MVDAKVEIVHIADGVHTDSRSDDADDQRHDERKRIEVQRLVAGEIMGEAEFKDQSAHKLDNCQDNRGNVLVLHAEADDRDADNRADGQARIVDDRRLERVVRAGRSDVRCHQGNGRNSDNRRANAYDNVARLRLANHHQQSRNNQREQD